MSLEHGRNTTMRRRSVSFQIGNCMFCNANGIRDTISDTRRDLIEEGPDTVGTDAVSQRSLNLGAELGRPILG